MTHFTLRRGPWSAVAWGMAVVLSPAVSVAFDGWQGMRVISLDGRAERLSVADLEKDGRDDVLVVNPRQARIDIYRWLDPAARTRADVADPERPNELPMAPEWTRGEIVIDEMPLDAVAHDLDGNGQPEVLVFTSPSNRIAIYSRTKDVAIDARGAWKKTGEWNLLSGSPSSRGGLLLVRDLPGGKHELLVSFDEGIQRLPLEKSARAEWLAPREVRGRLDWALADVDGDGRADLVEWSSVARQVIRWHPCAADGSLLPAQTLHDRPVDAFTTAKGPSGQAEIFLLGGSDKGVLRQYRLVRGAATDVGRQDALPMGSVARRGWCGMRLDGEPAIVAADSTQPRLRVHMLTPSGWSSEQTFPAVGGIKAVVAPIAAAEEGLLLVWTKDAADLHRSHWEKGRLTYPQPWVQEGKDRKILALDRVGAVGWWAQRVGDDVDLFVWPPDAQSPKRTRFAGLGAKIDKVVWLGDDTLLVQDAYAPAAKLARLDDDGKTVVTSPSLLAKADLDEYRLLEVDGVRRKARITDGVLQWLGDDLHPVDQVMLGEGQKLVSFLPIPGADKAARAADQTAGGQAWALEKGGAFLHRLAVDEAGVMRTVETIKPPTGTALEGDPVLGVVLVDQERIVRLSRGEPWELQLVESVDGRVGRRSGVRESTIHRVLTTDVDGDGGADVLLCDDRRHQLTAMLRRPVGEGKPAALERSVTWRVFDDRKYPYDGGDSSEMVSEPRRAVGLDADGDGVRDLVLVSQDRLLIYVGHDAAAAEPPADKTAAASPTPAKETR